MKRTPFPTRLSGGLLLCLLALLLSMVVTSECTAEVRTVTADGVSSLQGNNGISRDNAINDALKKAIEQAVGLFVSSETMATNAMLVSENIYSKTQGYIKEFKIVKETVDQDQQCYRVSLSAVIGVSDLENDLAALGLLQTRAGKPRTLFMISEFLSAADSPQRERRGATGFSEAAMKEEFVAKEFNVVEGSATTAPQNATADSEQSDSAARESAKKLGAEIVIKGTARVTEGGRTAGSPVGTYSADISATAIRVDNGQLLASGRSQGTARHIARNNGESAALEQAGRKIASKLIEQILAKWVAETAGTRQTLITVHGLRDVSQLIMVKEYFSSQLRGVQNVIQRSFSDGIAILDVSAKVSAQQIGDEVAISKVGGIILKVVGATANTLEIAVSTP